MNSFFRQMAVEKKSDATRLVNRDFRGQSGDAEEADVFYEQRNGQLKVAYPAFIDGTSIPRSGLVSEVDRRQLKFQAISETGAIIDSGTIEQS